MTSKEKEIIKREYQLYKNAMQRYIANDNCAAATESSMMLAAIGGLMDELKIERPK